MKRISIVFVLVLLAISCQGQQMTAVRSESFKTLIEEKKDTQLIDVRTKREYDIGKIKGATLIDFYRADFEKEISKLDKNKPVAVYCAVGVRSASAAKMLVQLGFNEVYDLKGGVVDWQKVGCKLVKD